jgi:hypothetical protein
MGGVCRMLGYFINNLKERDCMRNSHVGGRITTQWWAFFEHGSEPSGSIK